MDKEKNAVNNGGRVKLNVLPHAKDLKWPMLWWFAMGS